MVKLRSRATLLSRFLAGLTPQQRAQLELLAGLAQQRGSELYLVGGSVRDLLLGRPHLDIDVAVESDAPSLARTFARAGGARFSQHDTFRTAVVEGELRFDLVTARRERYPAPGALPVVQPAALADDLARRDFSINAMALALSGAAAGTLIDPLGGRADLAAGVLRVLHDASFRDDATRLWRAGRYAARLALHPEPRTELLLTRDRGYLDTISAARIHHELERTLDEPAAGRALRLLDGFGVLAATFPPLGCSPADAAALTRLRRLAVHNFQEAALAVLALDWGAAAIEAAIARLALDRGAIKTVRAVPAVRATLTRLVRHGATPGTAAPLLDRFPRPALAAVAARHPHRRDGQMAAGYLASWRLIRPLLTPAQLQERGVAPGPLMGHMLRVLRAARLDGRTRTLDDEERLVHTELTRAIAAPGED